MDRLKKIGVVAAGVTVLACSKIQELHMGTAAIAHTVCTAVFVSGVDGDRVYREALKPLFGRAPDWTIRYHIDREHREVRARILGAFEERAVLQEDGGCQNHPGSALLGRGTANPPRAAPFLPEIAGPDVVEATDLRLGRAVEEAFAPSASGVDPFTKALVVVRGGRIIAEHYGDGYGITTRLPGYSDTKSVISALIGVLVRQGRLSIHDPAPVEAWARPGDPRHGITVDHLLRMRSGLQWDETLASGPDDGARMRFLEPDMAALPLSRPLSAAPDARWQYNSGNTLVLSRILRDAAGGSREDVLRFAHAELFDPLGMEGAILEFDSTGTPVGCCGMLATARDWARFGLLYLQDGMVGSRRILPKGWVEYSATPAHDVPISYGAGFWTNRGDSPGALRRVAWGLPANSFFASGFFGQIILVVPDDRLVIARFGWSGNDVADADFYRALSDIVAAVGALPR